PVLPEHRIPPERSSRHLPAGDDPVSRPEEEDRITLFGFVQRSTCPRAPAVTPSGDATLGDHLQVSAFALVFRLVGIEQPAVFVHGWPFRSTPVQGSILLERGTERQFLGYVFRRAGSLL